MPYIVKDSKKDYTPAPEGLHQAVCIDVVDLGIQKTQFGDQVKIEVRWVIEEIDPKTQKQYMVLRRFTPSLHKKASLRAVLESWRGRKFTKEEEKEFDIEKLLGANCQLQIVHSIRDNGTFANVQACVPYPKNTPRIAVEEYIRRIDREKKYEEHPDAVAVGDEYVPF